MSTNHTFTPVSPLSKNRKKGFRLGWRQLSLIAIFAFVSLGAGIFHTMTSQAAASPLPFDLPSQATLKQSSKKVYAHYFTPYPISLDNKAADADYYARNYVAANGESGKHAAYGGLLRDRPLGRAVDSSASWQLNDMKTEVSRATAAGLDGFTVDMLGLSGQHWDRLKLLLQAAKEVDPNFKIVLMPDSNSSVVSSPAALAKSVAELVKNYKSSLSFLNDGRLVVSPFYAEKVGASWWSQWISIMKNTYGINVAFVPCFLNYSASVASFDSISYGFSNWGNRSPATNQTLSTNMADAHRRGKIWMQPVSVQDERPNQGIFDEANNTDNLRTTWKAAIAGADWVQIPTWNDYSESAEIAPSANIGWSPLDISSYYLTRFKTGAAPAIKRDVAYVSHRVQLAGAHPTGGQTKLMNLRGGSSPARDTVEVLSYLTAPATIKVTVGAKTYSYNAPAGEFSQLYPLQAGKVSLQIVRGSATVATVSSPFTVQANPVVQDLQYHFVSTSRNGTTTPPPASTGRLVGIAGKCLDNDRNIKASSNIIQLYDCNGTAAQKWTISSNGSITNANGYCLDVQNGAKTAQAFVQLYSCNGTGAQQWKVNGSTITNTPTGLCLDDKNAGTGNGNRIWMYGCNSTAAQKWTMVNS